MGIDGISVLRLATPGGTTPTVSLSVTNNMVTGYTPNGGTAISVSPPIPLQQFLMNPPSSLAGQTCSVSGSNAQSYTLGLGAPAPALPGTVPNLILTRNSSNLIASYSTPDGTSHPLSPPASLSDFLESVRTASPGTSLAAFKGQSYAFAGMSSVSDLSRANVVLLTNGATPPIVNGYTLNGDVFTTLPSGFTNLSPSAFADKVRTTMSGPMAALQGMSYGTSANSISTTSGSSIYVTGGNGAPMVVHGYADPQRPGENIQVNPPILLTTFLEQIKNAPASSPLSHLAGTTFNPVEVTFTANNGVISLVSHIAGQDQILVMENPPVPRNAPSNLYVQPSTVADLAVLLMMVAALKAEQASLDNQARLNMMQNAILTAQYQQTAIATQNDAEKTQAMATVLASLAGMSLSIAALGVASQKQKHSNEALYARSNTPQTLSATTTTPTTPGQPAPAAQPQASTAQPLNSDDYHRAELAEKMNNTRSKFLSQNAENLSKGITASATLATTEAKSKAEQLKAILENCQQLNQSVLGMLNKDVDSTNKEYGTILQTIQQMISDYTKYVATLMRADR